MSYTMQRYCLPLIFLPCFASCVFLHHESPDADIPNVRVLDLDGGVQLTWDAIPGAEKYGIWRRAPEGLENWEELGETSTLAFVDGNARRDIAEAYAVRVYKGDVLSGFETVYGTAQQGIGIPNACSKSLPGAVKLTWNKIADAESYGVWRRHPTEQHWIELGSTTDLFFIDHQAREQLTESYAVRARKGEFLSEIFTVVGVADEKLAIPRTEASGGPGGVKLSWNAVPNADRYVIQRQDTKTNTWVEIGSTTSLQYFDECARPGVEEAYSVRACKEETASEFTVVRGIAALGIPQVTVTSINGGVKLTWHLVPMAEYYEVWRTFSAKEQWNKIGSTTLIQFTDTTIEPETAETYAVRAVRQNEVSQRAFVEGVPRKGYDAPELTAISRSGFIELKWTAAQDADRYSVWRRNEENTDWIHVTDTNSCQALDEDARYGISEVYVVRAYRGKAFSESSAVSVAAFEGIRAPQLTATGLHGGVHLMWTPVFGTEMYSVWRRNDADTDWIALGETTATVFVDSNGRREVMEKYAVRAHKGDIVSLEARTQARALQGLGMTNVRCEGVNGGVKITWDAVPEADRYIVWRYDDSVPRWVELVETKLTEYIDETGRPHVKEKYGVRVFSGDRASPFVPFEGMRLPDK